MTKDKKASVQTILDAADHLARTRGASGVTVEAVAREAGCSKGLVHYHFKTKAGLLEGLAERLARSRAEAWRSAFRGATTEEAVSRTWALLTKESATGASTAWATLFASGSKLPDRTVKESLTGFAAALGEAAQSSLESLGLRPRIPAAEIGWFLSAVVSGMGQQLAGGVSPDELEGAYLAAWLGVLAAAD